MIKRSMLFLACSSILLLLIACSGDSRTVKVGLAYDSGGRGDGAFNDAAYAGVTKAQQEVPVEVLELPATGAETDAERRVRLQQLARSGYNPVIAVGTGFSSVLSTVAAEFPGTSFVIIDVALDGQNIDSVVFASEQGSYLAGVIAATASKNGHIGFIGGMDIPLLRAFEAGYWQGAVSVRPDIVIDSSYLGDGSDASVWNRPDLAAQAASSMIGSRCDVIYAAAGGSNTGIFQALKDAGGSERGLWAIGTDSDQYNAPQLAAVKEVILTSILKRVDVAVYEAILGVSKGQPVTGVQRYDLARGGVGYATSNKALAPYQTAADTAAQRITSGGITVATAIRHLTAADTGTAVSLKTGDLLTVTLSVNASTGYSWSVAGGTGEVLSEEGKAVYLPGSSSAIGSSGSYRFTFRAGKPGLTTLRLVYKRQWETTESPAQTFVLTLAVTA